MLTTTKRLNAKLQLENGKADVAVTSTNPNVLFNMDASSNVAGSTYDWTASLNGKHIDLQAINLAPMWLL